MISAHWVSLLQQPELPLKTQVGSSPCCSEPPSAVTVTFQRKVSPRGPGGLHLPRSPGHPHVLFLPQECCSPARQCGLLTSCAPCSRSPPGHLCETLLSPSLVCFFTLLPSMCSTLHFLFVCPVDWLSLLERKFQEGHLVCPVSWGAPSS